MSLCIIIITIHGRYEALRRDQGWGMCVFMVEAFEEKGEFGDLIKCYIIESKNKFFFQTVT
jgi:hypothetical protein